MYRIAFAALLMVSPVAVPAQGLDCNASNDLPGSHWRVDCGLGVPADPASVSRLKAYLFDPVAGRVVPAVITEKTTEDFILNVQDDLECNQQLFMFAQGLTFKGKAPAGVLTVKVAMHGISCSRSGAPGMPAGPSPSVSNTSGSTDRTRTGSPWATHFSKVVKAKSKDDSNLYFAGTIWTVAGQDWNWAGSLDLKAQVPYRVGPANRFQQIGPFVTLQMSNDPSADPDSLKFGGDWTGRLVGIHGWFKGMFAKEEARIESTRDFTDQNFIADTRFTMELPSLVPLNKTFHGFLEPFFGAETGKNLKSPLSKVDGTGRARPLAGADFALTFTKIPHLQALGFNADYIRRWPLETELGYKTDAKGVLHLTSVGTAPKDHVTAKITFMINDLIGLYVGTEYGSEPPAFKLVDNKLTAGILIQAKFASSK